MNKNTEKKVYEIVPLNKSFDEEIVVPGSKSITNRAFLIAALSKGKTKIEGALDSDDTFFMKKALQEMGIKISQKTDKNFVVFGKGGCLKSPGKKLFLGNAGTTIRFLTAATSFSEGCDVILDGDSRMRERPIADLIKSLKKLGAEIEANDNNKFPPIKIKGKKIEGGEIKVSGKISSQYLSALLMLAPLAEKEIKISIKDKLVSKPYISMTIQVMNDFGVAVKSAMNYKSFTVSPQIYHKDKFIVEGDASSASYFFAIAHVSGSRITVKNISEDSIQGDIRFIDYLEKMGSVVYRKKDSITLMGQKKLKNLAKMNFRDIPDTAMTMMAVCAVSEGETVISGLETLKIKESDRIFAMKENFKKLGIKTSSTSSSMTIYGNPKKIKSADIEPYNDHRIAMSFAVIASLFPGIRIKNPLCVKKTYPDFYRDLRKLGIKVKKPKCVIENLSNNIYLIGMRATGKSRLGKLLAKKLEYEFIDQDKEIERQEKMIIPEIIKQKGWDYFRKAEKKVLKEISKTNHKIISTGGGAVLDPENVKFMKKSGIILQLKADINILAHRVSRNKNRPSLTGKSPADELREVWKERKGIYEESADINYDTSKSTRDKKQDFERKTDEIIAMLRRHLS